MQTPIVLFLLVDVPTPETGRKLVDASVVNGGPAPQGKQNGATTQVTVQRKRLLKAPTLAELDSSDSEVKNQDTTCFSICQNCLTS